jgi:hypothetical protein
VKERNEMTIGRTDDPEISVSVPAFEADRLFGTGSRTPSGPAATMPRQQAGHVIAIDPPVKILTFALEPKGPSTQDAETSIGSLIRITETHAKPQVRQNPTFGDHGFAWSPQFLYRASLLALGRFPCERSTFYSVLPFDTIRRVD